MTNLRAFHIAPRSGRTVVILLLGLAVLSVLGWFLFRGRTQEVSDDTGMEVVEQFLAKIREGNPAGAWDSTTAEFKSDMGREAFVHFAARRPALQQPATFVSRQNVSVNGLPRSEFVYDLAGGSGSGGKTVRLLIASEAGVWKIERLIAD